MAERRTRAEMEAAIFNYKQEIGRDREEISLLHQARKASEVLIKSLEERLKETTADLKRAHEYWQEDREELNKVRAERNDYRDAVDHLNGKIAPLCMERDSFRERLNRALGWIDHAQGKPPEVTVPEAGPGWDRDGGRLG